MQDQPSIRLAQKIVYKVCLKNFQESSWILCWIKIILLEEQIMGNLNYFNNE